MKALIDARSQKERDELKIALVDYSEKKLNFNNTRAVLLGEYFYLKSLYLMNENEKSFYEYLRENMDVYKCSDFYTKILKGFDSETFFDYKKMFGLWGGQKGLFQ